MVDFSVEDQCVGIFYCVDIFYWFDKSSKSILKEYFDFCNQGYQEVIKYISTHWLCTEHCINWKLKKYTGLQFYFLSESEKDKQFLRLNEVFSKNMRILFNVL